VERVVLTGSRWAACAPVGGEPTACGVWDCAASAEEQCEFRRTAATPKRTHEKAEIMRIDERRKVASENGLTRMLMRGQWTR
jgi:hypothetical protein